MKIHHLNCASLCPVGGRLTGGAAGRARLVCHCLLIETADCLVLVDTALGSHDLAEPLDTLGRSFLLFARPALLREELAIEQVRRLGFDPRDVRHIVITHLDVDHAGGLPDFPWASVHLLELEHQIAMARRSLNARERYKPRHWSHGPHWVTHSLAGGERWFGFEAVRQLPGLPPELLLIPLAGHTLGHCGVAVDLGQEWAFHCGDAYYHHWEMGSPASCPAGLRLFQRTMAMDNRQRLENQRRLRQLIATESSVRLFCAHDPLDLERAIAQTATPR